jgi:hypothetical protein
MRIWAFLPHRWWSPRSWKTWASYVHWRLETYGVYYPEGKFNRTAFKSMLRQLPSYSRWLSEMNRLRGKSPTPTINLP